MPGRLRETQSSRGGSAALRGTLFVINLRACNSKQRAHRDDVLSVGVYATPSHIGTENEVGSEECNQHQQAKAADRQWPKVDVGYQGPLETSIEPVQSRSFQQSVYAFVIS